MSQRAPRATRRFFGRAIGILLIFVAALASCGGKDKDASTGSVRQSINGCRDCMSTMCWNLVETSPGVFEDLPNYDDCARVPCPTLPDPSLAPFAEQVKFLWRDLQHL